MNQYILINHGVGTPENWDSYFDMLHEKNYIIGGSALDHGVSIKDGTTHSARSETITGYILIQAPDLDTAKELALKCPVHLAGGTVEVFTLVKDNE
jgi:hypothetical protein